MPIPFSQPEAPPPASQGPGAPQSTARSSSLKVARTRNGYCVRVEGRGTMEQSRALMALAGEAPAADGPALAVDLSACDYLDSTFLGCLLSLYRKAGNVPGTPGRLTIAAPRDRRRKLLGPTRLDLILPATDAPPEPVGDWLPLATDAADAKDLVRHVMECHRRLAEVEGPCQGAFRRIADQMEKDLGGESRAPGEVS